MVEAKGLPSFLPDKGHFMFILSPTIDKSLLLNSLSEDYTLISSSQEFGENLPSLSKLKSIIRSSGKVVIDSENLDFKPQKRKIGEKKINEELKNHFKREKEIKDILGREQRQSVICCYSELRLSNDELKRLTKLHDHTFFHWDGTYLVSPERVRGKADKELKESVKNNLKTVILSLLGNRRLSGTQVKEEIYEKFNLMLSSGTLYPTLHKLEEKGYLKKKEGVKSKKYHFKDKDIIDEAIDKKIKAIGALNSFLGEK